MLLYTLIIDFCEFITDKILYIYHLLEEAESVERVGRDVNEENIV